MDLESKIEAYGSLVSAVSELDDVERFLLINKKNELLCKLRSVMKSVNELADEFIEEMNPFGQKRSELRNYILRLLSFFVLNNIKL